MKYQLERIAGLIYAMADRFILRRIAKLFYSDCPEHVGSSFILRLALFQKVLGFNRSVPWPVHFTSMVSSWRNIRRGRRTYPGLSSGCYIQAASGIVFGSNIRIGPNVCIVSANHSPNDYDLHIKAAPIEIGSNVWIGANSVVLPGVKIGDNVIIGAGSVVSNNISGDSVAAGNPCRVVKSKPPYAGKSHV